MHRIYPTLIDEACIIDAGGVEQARMAEGETAPVSDLSPDESGSTFFHPTLAEPPGDVYQGTPYLSADSNRWVVPNATPIIERSSPAAPGPTCFPICRSGPTPSRSS